MAQKHIDNQGHAPDDGTQQLGPVLEILEMEKRMGLRLAKDRGIPLNICDNMRVLNLGIPGGDRGPGILLYQGIDVTPEDARKLTRFLASAGINADVIYKVNPKEPQIKLNETPEETFGQANNKLKLLMRLKPGHIWSDETTKLPGFD